MIYLEILVVREKLQSSMREFMNVTSEANRRDIVRVDNLNVNVLKLPQIF